MSTIGGGTGWIVEVDLFPSLGDACNCIAGDGMRIGAHLVAEICLLPLPYPRPRHQSEHTTRDRCQEGMATSHTGYKDTFGIHII